MHYSAGDKVVFRIVWQDYEGRGKAPSSFTVSLQQVNVDTGAETIVSPTLIAAANSFTGVYVYYYMVPASGNYTFCARGVTADTTIMAMEIFGEFESGRAWVESIAGYITDLDLIIKLLRNAHEVTPTGGTLYIYDGNSKSDPVLEEFELYDANSVRSSDNFTYIKRVTA